VIVFFPGSCAHFVGSFGNVAYCPVNARSSRCETISLSHFVGPERAIAPFTKHSRSSFSLKTTSCVILLQDKHRENCTGPSSPRDTTSSNPLWLMSSMSARTTPFLFQARFMYQHTDLGLQALLVSCQTRRFKYSGRGLDQRCRNTEDSRSQRRKSYFSVRRRARRGTILG